ncbi:MAG: hypothetical protein ABMB14_36395, partial [Myxococcota bacterium]
MLVVPLLIDGGLVAVGVAAAVALAIAAPAAVAEWRTPPDPNPSSRAAVASVAEIAGLVLVAAATGELAAIGWIGGLLGVGVWIAARLLIRRPGWTVVPAVAGLGLLAVVAGFDLRAAPPWTLLAPQWDALPRVLGPAAAAGVLLAAGGLGQWTLGPPRPPA